MVGRWWGDGGEMVEIVRMMEMLDSGVEVVEHRCAALASQPYLPSVFARLALPTLPRRTTISNMFHHISSYDISADLYHLHYLVKQVLA